MTIENVKEIRDFVTDELQSYVINDVNFCPISEENSWYQMVQEWISEGNKVEPFYSKEYINNKLEKSRISKIKAKASELITSKYPTVWQLNHPRTDVAYASDYAYIDSIRNISNEAEANGTTLENINWEGN